MEADWLSALGSSLGELSYLSACGSHLVMATGMFNFDMAPGPG